jgi:hypothetical protein
MALASESYVGNGTNRDFVVPFPYISRNHVTVSVNGTGVPFVWLTAGTIRTDTAPANGATVRVQRTTPSVPLTDFADGDGNYEAALDIAALQPLYRVQELEDFVTEAALGGAAAVASSITFAPAGTLASTNVQAAVVESMTDLRAELAPKDAPALTGDVRVGGTLYRGGEALVGGVPFQIDLGAGTGQARFRHSTGLGFLINQSTASGAVFLNNQDNASMVLSTNNTDVVQINADQTVNLLGGAGKLRIGGDITRAELVTGTSFVGGNLAVSAAHGGPRAPDNYDVVIRLNAGVDNGGYSPGDEISLKSGGLINASVITLGWANATTVGFAAHGPNTMQFPLKNGTTTFQPAAGRWIFVFKCLWL